MNLIPFPPSANLADDGGLVILLQSVNACHVLSYPTRHLTPYAQVPGDKFADAGLQSQVTAGRFLAVHAADYAQ